MSSWDFFFFILIGLFFSNLACTNNSSPQGAKEKAQSIEEGTGEESTPRRPASIWSENIRANIRNESVFRDNNKIFNIQREGFKFKLVPANPSQIFTPSSWYVEVDHTGHTQQATWNEREKSWSFLVNSHGIYKIYVLQKISSDESVAYLWFSLSNGTHLSQ